jgi:hypothetical protein
MSGLEHGPIPSTRRPRIVKGPRSLLHNHSVSTFKNSDVTAHTTTPHGGSRKHIVVFVFAAQHTCLHGCGHAPHMSAMVSYTVRIWALLTTVA